MPMTDQPQQRFVVLRHDAGANLERTGESHADWMFESDGGLRTWASELLDSFETQVELNCEALSDHRIEYLDYEGEVSRGRGRVVQLLRGTYRVIERDENQFVASLAWQEGGRNCEATAGFYRSLRDSPPRRDDSRDCWRLRFSPGRYDTNR